MRISHDYLPGRLTADKSSVAYIHALSSVDQLGNIVLSPSDQLGNIERGAELYRDGEVDRVVILDLGRKYKGQYGTPVMQDDEPSSPDAQMIHSGWREWSRLLHERGVPLDKIEILRLGHDEYQRKYYHTHTEAEAVVERCDQYAIDRLIIVSSPWHIVRAMCENVSQALRERSGCLAVYAATANLRYARGWTVPGLGSQSTIGARTTPLQELEREMAKLVAYCAQGDLEPAKEILDYFDRRDALNS